MSSSTLAEIITTASLLTNRSTRPTLIGEAQTESTSTASGVNLFGETLSTETVGYIAGNVLGIGGTLGSAIAGAITGAKASNVSGTATLRCDIIKSVTYDYEQEVSSHPVETGFEVQDNVVNKPLKVTMTIGVSSRPVTWLVKNGVGVKKFKNAYDALVAIRDAKQPVTITRPNLVLSDMLMTRCQIKKTDESLSVIEVEVEFVKITKVSTETVEIPADIVDAAARDKAGETAAAGGAASTSDAISDAQKAAAEAVEKTLKGNEDETTALTLSKKT